MIGSLLLYVLCPLSRYLARRRTDTSEKTVSPAVVNDTSVWDGGAVKISACTQSQTALLEEQHSPYSGSTTETKERMTEQNSENKEDTGPDMDKEQSIAVLLRNDGHQEEDTVEPFNQECEKVSFHYTEPDLKQSTDITSPCEVITAEQQLLVQLGNLKTEDTVGKASSPVQEESEMPSLKELLTLSGNSSKETTSPVQKESGIQVVEELVTPHKDDAEVMECWDEYIAPAGGENQSVEYRSELMFVPPVSYIQTQWTLSGQHNIPTGCHFPVGPGLAREVECPLWQCPAVSYYPPTEPTVPFEVMWRVWEDLDETASVVEPALIPFPFKMISVDFTVMSYNILAQDLLEANQDLYTHCPLEVLEWSHRFSLLLQEIQRWAPDILCLQEVQENYYYAQLQPVLSQMGYTCVYKRRTGSKTDGCATCYRSSCFSEVSVIEVEFFRPEVELLDRHNVAIILVLQPLVFHDSAVKVKSPPLCVANTHLLFNPKRGDVKLAQLAILLAEISSVVKSCRAKGEHCNIILCGDFNALPHMPLYQLITTGELYYQGLPAWMVSGQENLSYKAHFHRLCAPLWPVSLGITDNCQYANASQMFEHCRKETGKIQYSHEFLLQLRFCSVACARPHDLELIPGVTDNTPDASREHQPSSSRFRRTVSHRLDLHSAYKHILLGSGSPEVTTLHSEGAATVDYIFYSPQRPLTSDQKAGGDFVSAGLKLKSRLSLLSEDVLWSMNGLPNYIFPSDHLSLLAKFQLDVKAE